jgi:CheY-like chemotaxis protein
MTTPARTAVIADDSPTMRRIVTNVLEGAGWRVVEAADGVQAVQAVFQEQPDVVVLDVQMPRMPGTVVARILKEDWATADIPIVLLTALDAAGDRYWGNKSGTDRYLTKDFEADDLARTVEELATAAPRGSLRADPVTLSESDVLEKMCEVLERTLYQTSLAADVMAVSSKTHGFEATVAALLSVLTGVLDHSLAGVILCEERVAYTTAGRPVSQAHLAEFLGRAAEVCGLSAADLQVRMADPDGRLGAEDDEAELATFVSMPLRGYGGSLVGVVALSSDRSDAYGDAALETLRLVEGPAALVVDAARLSRTSAPA